MTRRVLKRPIRVPDSVLCVWGLHSLQRPDQSSLMNATCGKETTMRDPKPLLTSIIVAVALVVPMAVWAADHTGNDHAPPHHNL
jgi:hypothetical protein